MTKLEEKLSTLQARIDHAIAPTMLDLKMRVERLEKRLADFALQISPQLKDGGETQNQP